MLESLKKEKNLWLLIDGISIFLAFFIGLFLRFDGDIPPLYLRLLIISSLPLITYYLFIFSLFRLYRHLWRYESIFEFFSIFTAVSSGTLSIILLTILLPLSFLPLSVLFISWPLLLVFVGGSRIFFMYLRQSYNENNNKEKEKKKRILMIGAGDAGEMILRELKKHGELNYQVIGFIDDDPMKKGLEIHGVPVLGTSKEMLSIIVETGVKEVILAIPSASGSDVRRLLEICKKGGVHTKILPGMYEIIDNQVHVSQIRDVQVEDLLRREPVDLITEEICKTIHQKVVLVTGGGGSIGSEICRQVIPFNPSSLVLFDCNENNIYKTIEDLEGRFPAEQIHPVIGSIQDKERLKSLFLTYGPQVLFHAAAHKHVPLMEYNPGEAVKNNIIGTLNVAHLAHHYRVDRFVMISTDKAVNPTNVMGATKRVAEMIIESLNQTSKTCFMAVRFGNVLESSGSVIPTFKRQIQRGGPLRVTHREVTRYFMTIPEAAQLVIQAGALGEGGEVFLLDMGDPVPIVDLAQELIRLSGLEPHVDIEIEYVGLRPGEKLYEELLTPEENTIETKHQKIFIARLHSTDPVLLETKIKELERAAIEPDRRFTIPSLLHSLVPSYTPEIIEREDGEEKKRFLKI